MSSAPSSPPGIEYGMKRISWARRAWRILRITLLFLLPLVLYAGTYLIFAKRFYLWGGGWAVRYPGMIRYYAFTSNDSSSLGNSEKMIERHKDAGGAVREFDDSL